MAEESDLERSYPASQRRLEQAREHGQVARSRELTAAAVALVGTLGIAGLGPQFVARCADTMRNALRFDRGALRDDRMLDALHALSQDMLVAFAPLLFVILVATLAAPMLLSGWLFAGKALLPDFGRLNPAKGLKNIFSGQALAELLKALMKSGLLAVVGTIAVVRLWPEVQGLAALAPDVGIRHLGGIVVSGVFMLVGALVVIAGVDVPYQLWRHYRGLRMTREELRQEQREQEGDPHLKARIRTLQRQAARKRMMAAVPSATVIVTNPTHYAVALHYGEGMRAPKVVAKGVELVAQRIRELGAQHRVPVLEAPPLARALYRHAEIGAEIPQALYTVVAQVLAYVYQVQRWQQRGGPAPAEPVDLAVPPELDPQQRAASRESDR